MNRPTHYSRLQYDCIATTTKSRIIHSETWSRPYLHVIIIVTND